MDDGLRTSEVPNRIPPPCPHVTFHIHPKGQDHVNNNGRTQGKQGDIHKPHADATGGDTHPVAYSGKHPKGFPFNKIFETVHGCKIIFFRKRVKPIS